VVTVTATEFQAAWPIGWHQQTITSSHAETIPSPDDFYRIALPVLDHREISQTIEDVDGYRH
jgi:hypothetical protein